MSLLDRAISLVLPAVPKPIVRKFSRRYIAGSTMDEAFAVVRDLAEQGAMSSLDILGEFISSTDQARRNADEYEQLITQVAEQQLPDTYISIKLTALGLSLDPQLCLDNMRRVMARVDATDAFLRIDMEDSACTTTTLDIYKTLRAEFPGKIGAVLQSCLRRTVADVEDLTGEPANVRLCKGIYVEPRRIAFTDPELIRRNFALALHRLFSKGAYVGIATHDEILVWESLRLIEKFGLRPDQYEFQMLLGVDEALRRILLDAGHRLRVYVPYGEQWYQYSVRRLRENPKIAGYAFKAILQRD